MFLVHIDEFVGTYTTDWRTMILITGDSFSADYGKGWVNSIDNAVNVSQCGVGEYKILKQLQNRGYDSAGLATLSDGLINEVKSEGRVENLEKNLAIKNQITSNIFPGVGRITPFNSIDNKIAANL